MSQSLIIISEQYQITYNFPQNFDNEWDDINVAGDSRNDTLGMYLTTYMYDGESDFIPFYLILSYTDGHVVQFQMIYKGLDSYIRNDAITMSVDDIPDTVYTYISVIPKVDTYMGIDVSDFVDLSYLDKFNNGDMISHDESFYTGFLALYTGLMTYHMKPFILSQSNTKTVNISCETQGATILTNLEGLIVGRYIKPLNVVIGQTIVAKATKDGMEDSDVASQLIS